MRVVHVPIEAHVQHAIAVEKRDWSILATTRKRAQRVRNGPVHATFSTPALEVGHCPSLKDFNEEG